MKRFISFIESHPRTGWYIAVVVTLDFLAHVFEIGKNF